MDHVKKCIIIVRKKACDEINRNGGIMEVRRSIYLDKLIESQKNGMIKVLTGIARCGRSYLLYESFYDYLISKGIGESHIIEIPLEDRSYKKLRKTKEILAYIKSKVEDKETYYVILDEIWLLENYKDVIDALMNYDNLDIYISGSDMRFIYEEVFEEFGYACQEIRIRPMCFREVVSAYEGDDKAALNDYLKYGGLPMVLWMESMEDKKKYVYSELENVYLPHLKDKYKIRNISEFEELILVIAGELGKLTNPLQLVEIFKEKTSKIITDKTVKKYIDYLSTEMLVNKVFRYDIKKRKHITTPVKYYFEDVGLRNAILGFEAEDESEIAENIIFNELKLRGYTVDIGAVEFNYKDVDGKNKKKQLEVSFIATKGDKKYYIQSAYENDEELSKELQNNKKKTLGYIKDSFKKIVVVKENVNPFRDECGIVTMGFCKFLLDENSLEL